MEISKRLVLIDGHAILHRAFHALPPLTNSGGKELGAVFGFCSMLWRVIQDLKPQYLVVAFDLPKPTFRQKLYKEYQAQRPEMVKELVSQVDLMHRVLEMMGIPVFEKEGYEADDLIGTIAVEALAGPAARHLVGARSANKPLRANKVSGSRHPQEPLEVIIVTGDRDMLQLVNEYVKVYAPVKGITQTILYDEKLVEEKYGLKPKQWVDYKALIGDPSDNYPGVTGVGPKTAGDLLKKYGSLDEVLKNMEKLPEKLAQSLTANASQVKLAKELATIVQDVPIEFDLAACQLKDLKNPQVEKLFKELEFKSLWERIKKNNVLDEKPTNHHDQLTFLN